MKRSRPKLLIVDDQSRYAELAHALLRDYDYATLCELPGPCWDCEYRRGCNLTHARDWSEVASVLVRQQDIDVVLLDLDFSTLPPQRLLQAPGQDQQRVARMQGLEILRRLRQTHPAMPVVLMTSRAELEFESDAAELEADEFVTLAGGDALDARALSLLIERILRRAERSQGFSGYVWGDSSIMARIRADVRSLAASSLPMLITGNPGCGKSALAEQVIHPATGRSGPLMVVDLATIPENLVAAELFGSHVGAFSGAVDRPGCFERADGGTVFLDEIGNLPMAVQRMLLLTLQSGRITRLGGGAALRIDVKVIAATNSDLEAAVASGAFRADLYARLNPAARIALPGLVERKNELPSLGAHFVRKIFESGADRELLASYCRAAGLAGTPEAELVVRSPGRTNQSGVAFVMSAKSLAALGRYGWPGNVREFEFLIKNATILSLSDALQAVEAGRGGADGSARYIPIPDKLILEMIGLWGTSSVGLGLPAGGATVGQAGAEVQAGATLRDVMRDRERELFERLYRETGGDFVQMAQRLLIGDPQFNARKVRLRFNQLGLRVSRIRANST